ncbi:MAG: SRPBCC domain-containing protein [Pseudomonadota bacterium]
MARVKLKRRLSYPPEMVWAALTDSDQMANWLMPNDFRPEVRHVFQFKTKPAPGFDGIVDCEVLEIDPLKELAISWKGGGIDTVVRFLLTPVEGGTSLELIQDGFAIKDVFPYFILGQGWKKILRKNLPMAIASIDDRSM